MTTYLVLAQSGDTYKLVNGQVEAHSGTQAVRKALSGADPEQVAPLHIAVPVGNWTACKTGPEFRDVSLKVEEVEFAVGTPAAVNPDQTSIDDGTETTSNADEDESAVVAGDNKLAAVS